jgi:hypothetical protein
MMFARLKELRDTLASIPAFAVSAETREELVKAIDALDDEMVMDVRARHTADETAHYECNFDIDAHEARKGQR